MKKILFILAIAFLSVIAFGKDYNFATDKISATLTQEDKLVYFSSIINKNTNTECIEKEIGQKLNIWSFTVKKNREYGSEEIKLDNNDAEKLSIKNNGKITLTWTNVKKSDWANGFDVIVTGEKKDNNTYWHIKIKSNTNDYGIWEVSFPSITVRFHTGDEWFSGLFGGNIETKNIPKQRPGGHGYDYNPWIPYPVGDMPMQFMYETQNGSGIYLCPEDTDGWHKHFVYDSLNEKEITYIVKLYPNDQGVGGVSYSQPYKFNLCAFDGDWFDGVKKYRAWGIKAGGAPFKKGRIAERTDFPNWIKKNVFWGTDWQKIALGNVNTAFHWYMWWHLPHDVGYPEMLPADPERINDFLGRAEKNNMEYVFYTNCHLIDTKNSPLYLKYGDALCNINEKGEKNITQWAKEYTVNSTSCPSLDIIQDTATNLNTTLIKEYHSNGVYLDELCMGEPEACYNEKHGHPVGTGNRWVKEYSKLMERIMKEGTEIAGDPIVIFSEGTAEPYPCDMELDLQCNPTRPYGKAAYYSGYRIIWGNVYQNYDFIHQDAGIAKMAYCLCGGWQLGWYEYYPAGTDKWNYPKFEKYELGAVKARENAIDFFNLGEMVRSVKITNNIPYVERQIDQYPTEATPYVSVPSVQTSSWNLDGKTMLVFTNITEESQFVKWESKAKDLYLEKDTMYNINQTFPVEKNMGKGYNDFKSAFSIEPLETIIVVVSK